MRIVAGGLRPVLIGLTSLAAGAVAFATATGPSGAAPSRGGRTQEEIAVAFRAFAHLPSVSRGRATLQGFDPAMALALEQAGSRLQTGYDGWPPKLSEAIGTATLVRPGEAKVPLTITVTTKSPSSSYGLHYTAVALQESGRWQVSWTTMCMLVEAAGELCPPAPAQVVPGDVLPFAVGGPLDAPTQSPGLVNPGPLAIAPDGGVLIADSGRNQILKWKDGALTVFAGDALQGFSGDGGPAVDAELSQPEEIAVSPSGTVYFVDSGNSRIRAVTPGGTIETVAGNGMVGTGADVGDGGPATAAPLNPSGVAVSPAGVLFISSNSAIREVEPDGIVSTLLQGGPPAGVDVQGSGGPVAFFPDSLALNGQGDLIVWSSSPKELFSVNPSGHVTELGTEYATALSTAPDGSVLVSQHGPGLERVNGSTLAALPADLSVVGLRNPIVADGIAEAPSGTTFVDAALDGYNDNVGLYEIIGGTAHAVEVTSTVLSTLPATGAQGFPWAAYPPAVTSTAVGAALPSCPSLQGVSPFTPTAKAVAVQLLGGWNSDFSYNLHASDRSWWAGVVRNFTGIRCRGPADGGRRLARRGQPVRPGHRGGVWAAAGQGLDRGGDGAVRLRLLLSARVPPGPGWGTARVLRRRLKFAVTVPATTESHS